MVCIYIYIYRFMICILTTYILSDIVEANRHPIAIKNKHEGKTVGLYYRDMESYGGTLIGIKLTFSIFSGLQSNSIRTCRLAMVNLLDHFLLSSSLPTTTTTTHIIIPHSLTHYPPCHYIIYSIRVFSCSNNIHTLYL